MKLHELRPAEGSKKSSKRIGRGTASGWGKSAGKGQKGQNSRSGGGTRPGFEGGQMPLYRRIPKRGFTVITPELLLERRVIRKVYDGVKILGNGNLEKNLTVKASKFSTAAAEKIEAAGGKVEVI